ncbi:MAG: fibronectin type III domain-containing protein [Oscillospiraceae bacterium]
MTMTKKVTASVLALAMSVNMAFAPIEEVSDFSDAFVVCSAASYDVTAPAIPTSIKAVSDANAITLSWKKVNNATGYRIYRYIGGKWTKVKTTKALSFTDTDLDSATVYKYKVKAYIKKNGKVTWGKASDTFRTATDPTATVITGTGSSYDAIRLKWKAVDCTGYQIFQLINGKWERIATLRDETKAETYRIEGLEEGTAYSFKVRPFYKADKNYFGSSVRVDRSTKVDKTAPSAPSITSTSATKDAIRINWTDVKADSYQVYMLENGSWKLKSTVKNVLTYKFSGLTASTEYKFKVRAVNVNRFGENLFGGFSAVTTVSTKEADFFDMLTPTERAYYNLAIGYPSEEDKQLVRDDCLAYTFEKFSPLMNGDPVTIEFSYQDGDEEVVYDSVTIEPPVAFEFCVNSELYANSATDTNAGFYGGTGNDFMAFELERAESNSKKLNVIHDFMQICHVGTADVFFTSFSDKINTSTKKMIIGIDIGIFYLYDQYDGTPKYQITMLYGDVGNSYVENP